jgi:hypothetical protein
VPGQELSGKPTGQARATFPPQPNPAFGCPLPEPRRNGNIISHFALTHRMTNSQRLAKVRSRLLQWIANEASGSAPDESVSNQSPEPTILRESILIRDDFFCGRRFYTADHHAVWFIEQDELKIYGNDGDLLCVLAGGEIESEDRADILRLPEFDSEPSEGPLPGSGQSTAQPSKRRAA